MLPVSTPSCSAGSPLGASTAGVSSVALPIFDAPGQVLVGLAGVISTCSAVHASSPFAADGLIVNPSGKVTVTVFRCAVASSLGFWFCGVFIVTSAPSGSSILVVSGLTSNDDGKGTAWQFIVSSGTGVNGGTGVKL